MPSAYYKLVVYSPVTSANAVRAALSAAGAGRIGNYDCCSFSSRGEGRFRGNSSSHPAVGKKEEITIVEEERIEVLVAKDSIKNVVDKMKKAHPYEEVAYDIYETISLDS